MKISYTSPGYTIDAWCVLGSGSVILKPGYITIDPVDESVTFRQYTETYNTNFLGKIITLSAIINNEFFWGTGVVPKSMPDSPTNFIEIPIVGNGGVLRLRGYGGYLYADISTNEALNVYAMKLESGTEQTLSNDPGPDIALEMLRCEFLYQTSGGGYPNRWVQPVSSNSIHFPIDFESVMRAVPTVTAIAKEWAVDISIPLDTIAWPTRFFASRSDGLNFEAGHMYYLEWTADASI
jgi:hypothetical protein